MKNRAVAKGIDKKRDANGGIPNAYKIRKENAPRRNARQSEMMITFEKMNSIWYIPSPE
jgi:hypothetical protein